MKCRWKLRNLNFPSTYQNKFKMRQLNFRLVKVNLKMLNTLRRYIHRYLHKEIKGSLKWKWNLRRRKPLQCKNFGNFANIFTSLLHNYYYIYSLLFAPPFRNTCLNPLLMLEYAGKLPPSQRCNCQCNFE